MIKKINKIYAAKHFYFIEIRNEIVLKDVLWEYFTLIFQKSNPVKKGIKMFKI